MQKRMNSSAKSAATNNYKRASPHVIKLYLTYTLQMDQIYAQTRLQSDNFIWLKEERRTIILAPLHSVSEIIIMYSGTIITIDDES